MSQRISEDQLQAQCVEWFRLQYPDKIIFAIPNGGLRNKIVAAKLKRCGVLAGVPDLCIASPKPNSLICGLYIELKVGKNKLTKEQEKVQNKLSYEGYSIGLCYTFDEFMKVVNDYLNN